MHPATLPLSVASHSLHPIAHPPTSAKWSVNHTATVTSPFTARPTSNATASSCGGRREAGGRAEAAAVAVVGTAAPAGMPASLASF